jgi:fumarylacetoacetase
LENLPFGVFVRPGHRPRIGVAIGDHVLAMGVVAELGLLPPHVPPKVFRRETLNEYLGLGPDTWESVRSRLTELLTIGNQELVPHEGSALIPSNRVDMVLPVEVGDFVDFYSSRYHAENVGRILRPNEASLPPAWLHLPIGYHGRAGTVVVGGTPIRRPRGQRGADDVGPTRKLDFELEVGFLTGPGNRLGEPIPITEAQKHVFGLVLVNDWSARDLQAFESRPLGPFLGKSFATSISPWVVPLEALRPFRFTPPVGDPAPAAYMRDPSPWSLDLELEVLLRRDGTDTRVCRSNYRYMQWTITQQLAHVTSNGAIARPGDLFASGTVSGPGEAEMGSLLESTFDGSRPLPLDDGSSLSYLEDGDEVVMRGWAAKGDARLGFGEVSGRILPAHG